jgi:hypothetical protein
MHEESVIPSPNSTAPATSAPTTWWNWLRHQAKSDAAKTAFGAWLALRCYCTFLGVALALSFPEQVFTNDFLIAFQGQSPSCAHYTVSTAGAGGALAGIWMRWDTPWYLEIAAHGYSCYGTSVYMPLYPLLIRGMSYVTGGHYLAAALIISSIASFFVFYLLYQLARDLTGSLQIARATVITLALFPVSFFLMAAYTEAIFLVLALGAYLATRRGRWLLAGGLAALATLTRLQGILLLAPLGLELLLAQRSQLRTWRPWLALSLAPVGLALFVIYIRLTEGLSLPWEPLGSAQGVWHLHYAWPWQGIVADLASLIAQPNAGTILSFKLLDPLCALLFLGLAVLAFRRLNLPLAVFLVVMWLSSVIKVTEAGYTTSISRYMLGLFPAFIILGMLATRWPRLLRGVVAAGSGVLLSMYLFIFLVWGWVA